MGRLSVTAKTVMVTTVLLAGLLSIGCASEGTKHHNRGVELADMGQFEEAIAEFDQAIELHGDPLTYLARGATYGFIGDFDSALSDFDKAIEIDPSLVDAYSERGALHFLLDENEKAAADLERALSLTDDENERAIIKVLIDAVGGQLPEGELSPDQCREAASFDGTFINFEGLTTDEIIECGRMGIP